MNAWEKGKIKRRANVVLYHHQKGIKELSSIKIHIAVEILWTKTSMQNVSLSAT